jgi:hypothetical protein
MGQIEAKRSGFGWRVVGTIVTPFVVASAYLVFIRWSSHRFTTSSDYVALGVSVFAGAVFVALLPIRPLQRVLLVLVYIPAVAVLLPFCALCFSAAVFHDGL